MCTLNPAQTIIIAPDEVPVASAGHGAAVQCRGGGQKPSSGPDHCPGCHADAASRAIYNAYPQTLSGGANEAMT